MLTRSSGSQGDCGLWRRRLSISNSSRQRWCAESVGLRCAAPQMTPRMCDRWSVACVCMKT